MLAVLVLAGPLLAGPWLAAGDPFLELGLEEALTRATAEKKLLLVDFTAAWCTPCRKMEQETWKAPEVRAWLAQHALAIQVDVEREEELAQSFGITVLPTVVALRDGVEFERVTGQRAPAPFLAWVADVKDGRRRVDSLLARSRELQAGTDVEARHALAGELASAGLLDEALLHQLWVWEATRALPRHQGLRLTAVLASLAELAQKHAPAQAALLALLDGLEERIEAAAVPAASDWGDWTALCRQLGLEPRVLAYHERHRDAEGRLLAGIETPEAAQVVADVFELLMARERPLEAVRLYGDARVRAEGRVARYRARLGELAALDGEPRLLAEEEARHGLSLELARLYAALLLAGRRDEAGAVAGLLLATLDTPTSRLDLVRQGLWLVKEPQPEWGRWLDEAETRGADVRSFRRKLAGLGPAGR